MAFHSGQRMHQIAGHATANGRVGASAQAISCAAGLRHRPGQFYHGSPPI
jgi:hypothetical protein